MRRSYYKTSNRHVVGPSLMSLIVSVDVKHHVYFLFGGLRAQGQMKRREVEVGFHSWRDCLAAKLLLNRCFSDSVFVTLPCTAVKQQLVMYTSSWNI